MTEDGLDLYSDIDTISPQVAAKSDSCDDCSCISAQTEMPSDMRIDANETVVHLNPNGTFAAYASNTAVANEQKASPCIKSSHLETKRIRTEMDLYFELFSEEIISMKSKFEMVPEFQELRSEIVRLQNLNSEKDALISELTTQNISLKRNICSLYKTAKAEDAQKDLLLAEANRRLDTFHYKKNVFSRSLKDQYSQTDDQEGRDDAETKVSPRKSKEDNSFKSVDGPRELTEDRNTSTGHKRLLSPLKEDSNTELHTNAKQNRIEECDSNVQKTSISSDCQARSAVMHPETSGELNSSSDITETNELFFNLLPDTLKHSFLEYEKSQIAALNRLKHSFVNHDFMRSKEQTPEVNGSGHPSLKSPDSLIAKPYHADTHDSSKPFLEQTRDSNISKRRAVELPSFSSVNNLDDRLHDDRSKNERTENSPSMKHAKRLRYDRTREGHNSRVPFRTKNIPLTYKGDFMTVYRQRRERLSFLSKSQNGLPF